MEFAFYSPHKRYRVNSYYDGKLATQRNGKVLGRCAKYQPITSRNRDQPAGHQIHVSISAKKLP